MNDSLLDEALTAARDAATAAFASVFPDGDGAAPEVRLLLCATAGDPSQGYSSSEVRFAAPPGVAVSHHDKVAMALASMKAVAPEMYTTMVEGLDRGRRFSLGGRRSKDRSRPN